MRRWLVRGGAVLVLVALGLGAGYAYKVSRDAADVRGSPTREFVTTTTTPKPRPPEPPGIVWPNDGRDQERSRVATGVSLGPPFRRAWTFRARSYIEFPPAIAYGRLFFANNAGVLFAISTKTGKRAWRYKSGRCQAMSPAVFDNTVYATFLNRPPCNASGNDLEGAIVALSAGSGRVLWRKKIAPSESSPIVSNGVVFVGDWDGRVHAFAAGTGKPRWVFQAGDKVKDGMAVSGGRVFFGSYDGHVYALDEKTGKQVWRASGQSGFGGAGNFYATPTIAYGRVFIGSTDGKEYAFGATTGNLLWSQSTGGYVYSSAAVWKQRVFAGSYSGSLFCFDAATGDVLWSFRANGPISGSPTIVAGRVYFATLAERTYALDARTGRQVWTFPDGKYAPVVADKKRLYLTGHARVYGLDEKR